MKLQPSISEKKSLNAEIGTDLIETLNNGVTLHTGWYADGYIATVLDGAEVYIGFSTPVYMGKVIYMHQQANFILNPDRSVSFCYPFKRVGG